MLHHEIKSIVTADLVLAYKETPERERFDFCLSIIELWHMSKATYRENYKEDDAEDLLAYLSFTTHNTGLTPMIILTKAQRKSLYVLHCRDSQGMTYRQFRRTICYGFSCDYITVAWCNMFICIERDGHRHS